MKSPAECSHEMFVYKTTLHKVRNQRNFVVCLSVSCDECKMRFRFMGLPVGLDFGGASVSENGFQVRLAITPDDKPKDATQEIEQ